MARAMWTSANAFVIARSRQVWLWRIIMYVVPVTFRPPPWTYLDVLTDEPTRRQTLDTAIDSRDGAEGDEDGIIDRARVTAYQNAVGELLQAAR